MDCTPNKSINLVQFPMSVVYTVLGKTQVLHTVDITENYKYLQLLYSGAGECKR